TEQSYERLIVQLTQKLHDRNNLGFLKANRVAQEILDKASGKAEGKVTARMLDTGVDAATAAQGIQGEAQRKQLEEARRVRKAMLTIQAQQFDDLGLRAQALQELAQIEAQAAWLHQQTALVQNRFNNRKRPHA